MLTRESRPGTGRAAPGETELGAKGRENVTPAGKWTTSEDWEVKVKANPTGRFMVSSNRGSHGNLDEADNTPIAKDGSAPGYKNPPTIHEFGHFLGLDHPGKGKVGMLWWKGNEYTYVGEDKHGNAVNGPEDLMGAGSEMRPFYFEKWADWLNKDEYPGDIASCEYTME